MTALWLRFWDHLFGIVRCVICGCAAWLEDADGWRMIDGYWRCPDCARVHTEGTVV
jgi:hypothetical protein